LNNQTVLAQKINRANSSAYLFALPISVALELLEIPDPAFPFPDNRRVNKKHAMEFGNYWEDHEHDWVVPPLLLDCPETLTFKKISTSNLGVELVELILPKGDREVLRILDGQHRILGWYLKKIDLDARLTDSNTSYNKAVIAGEKREATVFLEQITQIERSIARLQREQVSINLIDSLNPKMHQQFFVDIAKNALGINKTVQAKFDSSSIINRVTQNIIKSHPLLQNRIDLEKTSCSGTNPNLLTVVNVSDITRHTCFGVNRMVTARRENNYKDEVLAANVQKFLDIMVKNVPQLQLVIAGNLRAPDFREKYMLGSGTIWRCLAGAYYEACVIVNDLEGTIELDLSQVRKFERFVSLFADQMTLPISREWFATTLFPIKRSKAPSSRAQDLDAMVGLMTAWTRNGRLFFPKTPSGL
jgi:DGQHR domain-containing protein